MAALYYSAIDPTKTIQRRTNLFEGLEQNDLLLGLSKETVKELQFQMLDLINSNEESIKTSLLEKFML